MATASHVPAPPQGPGVHPPFPAPPVEGRGKRVGWTIGISIGVVLVVCGLGSAALIGALVASQGSSQEHAHAVVSSYLNALRAGKYDDAYNLLCDDAQQSESPGEFRARERTEPVIERYSLGDLDLINAAVPVHATYDDGGTAELEAYLAVDRKTRDYEVCSIGE
jgi:hypothetical protein